MGIHRFEDIEAWQEARMLVREIYQSFRECRDFSFKDQIQRAGLSVMSNIAEGFDRSGNKEFLHFLTISRGSLAEVKSLAYAAIDIGIISEEIFQALDQRCTRLKKMINGFILYLRNNEKH